MTALNTPNPQWGAADVAAVEQLVAQARVQGLWLQSNSLAGEFWYSPDRFVAGWNSGGTFPRFGAVNWRLASPQSKLNRIDAEIKRLMDERKEIEREWTR